MTKKTEDKKIGFWSYSYDDDNYYCGEVLNFKTKEDAIKHAKKYHNKTYDINSFEFTEIGEVLDIYTGE